MSQRNDWKLVSLHEMYEALKKYGSAGPKSSVERGKRGIVIGAMTQEEIIHDACEVWINGNHTENSDYHKEMHAENFEDWIQRSIPKFKKVARGRPIVIVMDNASYHSRYIEKPPRVSDTKATIADFLIKNGALTGNVEEITEAMNKNDLVKEMKTFIAANGGKEGFCKRAVENICSQHQIEVMA